MRKQSSSEGEELFLVEFAAAATNRKKSLLRKLTGKLSWPGCRERRRRALEAQSIASPFRFPTQTSNRTQQYTSTYFLLPSPYFHPSCFPTTRKQCSQPRVRSTIGCGLARVEIPFSPTRKSRHILSTCTYVISLLFPISKMKLLTFALFLALATYVSCDVTVTETKPLIETDHVNLEAEKRKEEKHNQQERHIDILVR